ncbi:MAG: DUF2059 domain-containing protein [Gammaproteobacteria bacterium]|nr:DUF2059 domain-containing protein [Gammaproteobacteria bacterium]MDH5513611.1 DUF2059 domain-containing protein [Gammaproteobacteria bacterium]
MKTSRRIATLVATAAIFLPVLSCADRASHQQAVEKLFELTHMQQKIEVSVNNVLALQLQQSPELREHEDLLKQFLEKNIGWSGMQDRLVTMYMEAFTEQELHDINTFYSTSAGQKMIKNLPNLIQQRDRLAMQRMQDNIGELQQAIAGRTGK